MSLSVSVHGEGQCTWRTLENISVVGGCWRGLMYMEKVGVHGEGWCMCRRLVYVENVGEG